MAEGGAQQRSTREKELARKSVGSLSSPFTAPVVGVTFVPGYPDNLHQLDGLYLEAESVGERLAAILIRNPDNEHDPNAIEVHVPIVGMIGHMVAPLAARLAPDLDAGVIWQAEVAEIRVSPDNPQRPGIRINCIRREHHG